MRTKTVSRSVLGTQLDEPTLGETAPASTSWCGHSLRPHPPGRLLRVRAVTPLRGHGAPAEPRIHPPRSQFCSPRAPRRCAAGGLVDDLPPSPAQVPHHLLADPALVRALRERYFTVVFAMAHDAALSFNRIAEACALKAERVSRSPAAPQPSPRWQLSRESPADCAFPVPSWGSLRNPRPGRRRPGRRNRLLRLQRHRPRWRRPVGRTGRACSACRPGRPRVGWGSSVTCRWTPRRSPSSTRPGG